MLVRFCSNCVREYYAMLSSPLQIRLLDGAIVVVVAAPVNFPVLENYADFLLEFCVGTLGIGAGSSRLEENPEGEDAVEEGAVHVQPHP